MIDGVFSGSWKVDHGRRATLLEIDLKRKVSRSELQAATGEAERLLAVAFPDSTDRDVKVVV
jgi:hypothetical protein